MKQVLFLMLLPLLVGTTLFAMTPSQEKISSAIATIPDFPKPGVNFRDITPMLANQEAFKLCMDEWAKHYEGKEVEGIVGLESRGFIFGAALADRLGVPFISVRKKGKLPGETFQASYEKEYGPDTIELQKGSVKPLQKLVVIDDVLATGGTAEAACDLIAQAGGQVVEVSCLLEVPGLGGRERLKPAVHILIP